MARTIATTPQLARVGLGTGMKKKAHKKTMPPTISKPAAKMKPVHDQAAPKKQKSVEIDGAPMKGGYVWPGKTASKKGHKKKAY